MKEKVKDLKDVTEKDIQELGTEGKHLENHIKRCNGEKDCKRWAVSLMFQDVSARTAEMMNKFEARTFEGTEKQFVQWLYEMTCKGYYINAFCEDDRRLPFE